MVDRLEGLARPALGRRIDLKEVRAPLFLLAARDDEWVAVPQLMATASLVGTPSSAIKAAVAPCSHLGLFMGAETLARVWSWIARWLGRERPALRSRRPVRDRCDRDRGPRRESWIASHRPQ